MKNIFKFTLLLISFVILLYSCSQQMTLMSSKLSKLSELVEVSVKSAVYGKVQINGVDATQKVDYKLFQGDNLVNEGKTNEQGWFFKNNIEPDKSYTIVFSLVGYSSSTVRFQTIKRKSTYVGGNLLSFSSNSPVDNSAGGTVTLDGLEIRVPAEAFVNLDGSIPASVTINIKYLSRADAQQFSGGLEAVSTLLESNGMFYIEAINDASEEVELVSDLTVVDSNQVDVCSEYFLWFYNEQTGLWDQRETDICDGYTVGVLGWWNIDKPLGELTIIDGRLEEAYENIAITCEGDGFYNRTFTDRAGKFVLATKRGANCNLIASGHGQVSTIYPINLEGNVGPTYTHPTPIPLTIPVVQTILEWGEHPRDLDSHLVKKTAAATNHISYSRKGSLTQSPFMQLDTDDTSSYGPEIITVTKEEVAQFRFSVHFYSGTGTINSSEARVTLIMLKGDSQVVTFTPPSSPEAGVDKIWKVFDLTMDTFGNVSVVDLNSYSDDTEQEYTP